jgi:protein involved in polysaccharide export with SLBB domain
LYGEDDLTRWVKVVPACYVVLPLIGQVQVLGLTIAAEAKIAAVYGKDVLINPSVTIEVLPAL